MTRLWTRRGFLGLTVGGSLAAWLRRTDPAAEAEASPGDRQAALRAFVDQIIPAAEGMPAASAVGALAYLETVAAREPGPGRDLHDCLTAIEGAARVRFGEGFARLADAQRLELLSGLEQSDARLFAAARDLVYEAYYTQPAVWQRLGYEFPPASRTAPLESFDERQLERVKRMGRLYREVR